MAIPLEQGSPKMFAESPTLPISSNGTTPASQVTTVKVSNVSLEASERDIKEFFSFSGDIEYVEIRSESEWSQLAFVTFKEPQGAETAILLSGATIVDRSVVITPAENYQLPRGFCNGAPQQMPYPVESAVRKAEDVVSSMLARGFILSKDALEVAKSFDERHQLLSTASATVASIDRQIGLTEKITAGTAAVSDKVREVDERFQVSALARSAIAAAEETATSARSAILRNPYMSTGASWLTSAFSMVSKAAGEVTSMTKEKLDKVEVEKNEIMWRERNEMVAEYAQLHLDEPSHWEPATVPVQCADVPRARK